MTRLARYLIDTLNPGSGLRLRQGRCILERFRQGECFACREACGHGALSFKNGFSVRETCTACGACLPACPTQALVLENRQEIDWRKKTLQHLREIDKTLCLACGNDPDLPHAAFLLPSLNRLDESRLLWSLAMGAQEILIKRCACPECQRSLWHKIIERTRAFLKTTPRSEQALQVVDAFPVQALASQDPGIDRREALSSFCGSLKTSLGSMLFRPAKGSAAAPEQPLERELLRRALANLQADDQNAVCPDGFPMAGLKVSESCRGCGVCVNLCPTQALFWEPYAFEEDRDGKSLLHRSWVCSGCGVCAQACHPQAITLEKPAPLRKLTTTSPEALIHLVPSTCPTCKEPGHGPDAESVCLVCSLRPDRF